MDDFFAHNWVAEFTETHSWRTLITAGEATLAEQRIQSVERPYRTFDVRWTGCDAGEAQAMRYQLMLAGEGPWQLPLYPDVWITTAVVTGTVLTGVDTSTRRFYAGQDVLFVDQISGRHQILTIASIVSTTVNFTGSPVYGIPVGALMYPLVNVAPLIEPPQIEWVCNDAVNVTIKAVEIVGSTALPSLSNSAYPGGTAALQDKPGVPGDLVPIWPSGLVGNGAQWRDGLTHQVSRTGESFPQGNDTLFSLRGDRSLEVLDYPVTICGDRAAAMLVLTWHDNRKGRTRSFWAPASQAFNVLSVDVSNVVVKAWSTRPSTLANAQAYLEYVAIMGDAGDSVVAEVASITPNGAGDEWTIAFTSSVVLPANLVYVTSGHFVRFASDTITARWVTNSGIVEFGSIGMQEVRSDKPVSLSTYP